ncbi:hypothetical protein COT97_03460 [Candidatus Falkowbacteria bacterium CG10_big_fil_rev_8_21_14_0_10_39_11]|uniref:Phosphoribosylaminoimidazole-succinocarboxamide synthase n=1 Tax=Candidatus Falkowbacteria bacterium CG10_big_fil_rev_8_21_14_0_10_39_11 TaxID=1974565 RepID=A0A2H0V4R3_9BACT|nr:MAG: hypothetical protein COT97_03460 [Candidatus Falkowbacteria bacterium CG10_big_fil_rev_8_21_14_0_10_39_11]
MDKVLLSELGWACVVIVENEDLSTLECIPFMGTGAVGQAKDFIKNWIEKMLRVGCWQKMKYDVQLHVMLDNEPHATNILTVEEVSSWVSFGVDWEVLAEGKTKRVYQDPVSSDWVMIESKPDITAGDGVKHDVMAGKAEAATETTSVVFQVLNRSGITTHFQSQLSETKFLAEKCEMIPLEVVVRRFATGSYLKRNEGVEEGQRLDELVVEFFFKDDAQHDPMVLVDDPERRVLVHAKDPIEVLGVIPPFMSLDELEKMEEEAKRIFTILERCWQNLDCRLWDMKVEFGHNVEGDIILADVIDNDSWRVTDHHGVQLDKQTYRDGSLSMDEIGDRYQLVATLVKRFLDMK